MFHQLPGNPTVFVSWYHSSLQKDGSIPSRHIGSWGTFKLPRRSSLVVSFLDGETAYRKAGWSDALFCSESGPLLCSVRCAAQSFVSSAVASVLRECQVSPSWKGAWARWVPRNARATPATAAPASPPAANPDSDQSRPWGKGQESAAHSRVPRRSWRRASRTRKNGGEGNF